MPDRPFKALAASRMLLKAARLLNLAAAAAFAVMLLASFLFEHAFRDYFQRTPRLDAGAVLPVMRLWVLAALPVFAAVHIMLSRLLAMVGTVSAGAPFVPENAARLRVIAWCLLLVQLFELSCGLFIQLLSRAGADVGEWDPSLSGWIAVLLLFVLARVFEEGARLRSDLDAMV
ncbi:MAG TPA: DUF2975 domain-containing protein [Allosphingosinicella sp.]|jgi:hypothetical protein